MPSASPRPLFSIITPSFNQAPFISQTVQSVLDQDFPDFEHVVIDAASTDGTVEILKQYPHLRWVSERDKGQADALNKGLAMTTGALIVWINSDDFLATGALHKVADFFRNTPEAQILSGNCIYVDREGRVVKREPPKLNRDHLRRPWLKDTSVFQPGIVFRRHVYDTAGPFDIRIHMGMDYDFFLRATEKFPIHSAPIDIGCFRVHTGTKTGEAMHPVWQDVKRSLPKQLAREGHSPGQIKAARFKLWLRESRILICDAMNAESAGNTKTAAKLYTRALLRNPLNLFCYPHVCYRARQLLGRRLYNKLRSGHREPFDAISRD